MSNVEWHKWHEHDPWTRTGAEKESSSHEGNMDGKYLFFAEDRNHLIQLIENEINVHGFSVAKVSDKPNGKDYVACLYWHNDSRKYELAERYKNKKHIKYRYYKSNADTRAGKYSKQFYAGKEV